MSQYVFCIACRVKATFQSVSAGVKKRAGQVNQRFDISGKAQQTADRYLPVNMVGACDCVLGYFECTCQIACDGVNSRKPLGEFTGLAMDTVQQCDPADSRRGLKMLMKSCSCGAKPATLC